MSAWHKYCALFLIGGTVYVAIELLWRGHSHWTMFLLGGLLFVLLGSINEWFSWTMPLVWQGFIGMLTVTAAELLTGIIVNIILDMSIWDYSHMPYNLLGQICLSYTIAWFFLSVVAIVLDDCLRYWLLGEDKPHYRIL